MQNFPQKPNNFSTLHRSSGGYHQRNCGVCLWFIIAQLLCLQYLSGVSSLQTGHYIGKSLKLTNGKIETIEISMNISIHSIQNPQTLPVKPGFHIVVSGLSRSLLNLKFRQILWTTIWKHEGNFCKDFKRPVTTLKDSQRLGRWDRLEVYLSDRERPWKTANDPVVSFVSYGNKTKYLWRPPTTLKDHQRLAVSKFGAKSSNLHKDSEGH